MADGMPTRHRENICLPWSPLETEWQGVLVSNAVTIIDPAQANLIKEKQRDRVISSRLVLLWKATDIGYKGKAGCCVHGFKRS